MTRTSDPTFAGEGDSRRASDGFTFAGEGNRLLNARPYLPAGGFLKATGSVGGSTYSIFSYVITP